MDFSIPDETRDLLKTTREFVEREVYPLEEQARSTSFNGLLPLLQEKRELVKQLGLWTPQIPTSPSSEIAGSISSARSRSSRSTMR